MQKLLSLVVAVLMLSTSAFSQRGKDGAKTVSSTQIVNEYTALTANAAVGASSISVAASSLNANSRFAAGLAPGDLIMIIQVQGAEVNVDSIAGFPASTPTDTSYGRIKNYRNCGNHELVQVASVPNSTTITLDCPLKYAYDVAGRVQVIRVPRYTTLTVNGSGKLRSQPWNGSTGGVLAVEVLGNTVINGSINLRGQGFRAGIRDSTTLLGGGFIGALKSEEGGEKGEGIGGNAQDYQNIKARYCRGSIANGGGGGNAHNAGGGGGSNAGQLGNWTGMGNPDPSYNAAWALEVPSIAGSTSSGGGRGGYTFSSANLNPLTNGCNGPFGPFTYSWSGDNRRNVGGWGGRPLNYNTGKIFMGGGGGAGEGNWENNAYYAGSGGRGGGIVFIRSYGTVTGNDSIVVDGGAGQRSGDGINNPFFTRGVDGAGGAGGGGAIIIQSTGNVSGIILSARGGKGGDQLISGGSAAGRSQAEGPGGGGGGGYIAVANGAPTRLATGGANGTTNSPDMNVSGQQFPPNGATAGGAGNNSASTNAWEVTASNDTICSGQTSTLTAATMGTPPSGASIVWFDALYGGSQQGSGTSFTTPVMTKTDTFYVGTCPGTYRLPVIVVVNAAPTANAGNDTIICTGDTAFLNASGGSTYTWDADADLSTTSGPNPLATPSATKYFKVTVSNGGCTDRDSVKVTVQPCPVPVAAWSSTDSTFCSGTCINYTDLSTNTPTSWKWYFTGGTPNTSTSQNPTNICYNTPGSYPVTLVATNAFGSDSVTMSGFITVQTCAPPVAKFASSDTVFCEGQCINFIDSSQGATSWQWYFPGATPGTSTAQNPTNVCYSAAGTYAVSLVATNVNGKDSIGITSFITVQSCPNPVAAFSASDSTLCEGQCITFTDLSTSNPTGWKWTFTGGTPGSSTSQNPGSICYNTVGAYPVKLVVTNANGSDSVTINNMITVSNCPPPTGGMVVSDTIICASECINYSDNSTNAITWSWTFQGGTPSTSGVSNPGTVCYTVPGTYLTTLIASNLSGSDTVKQTVYVKPIPTVNIVGPSSINTGDSAALSASGNPAGGTYVWTPGAKLTCDTCKSTSTVPLDTNTYIWVNYTSADGCSVNDSILIEVLLTIHYGIPNAFSPNGDGENDVLYVRGDGIDRMTLMIYNRYGQMVFKSEDQKNGWDGTHNGKAVNPGVFVYYLELSLANGETVKLKGNVTLVR